MREQHVGEIEAAGADPAVAAAWDAYLRAIRSCPPGAYGAVEPVAWRRLRRRIAALAHDERRRAARRDGVRLAG